MRPRGRVIYIVRLVLIVALWAPSGISRAFATEQAFWAPTDDRKAASLVIYRVNAGGNHTPGKPDWLPDQFRSPSHFTNQSTAKSKVIASNHSITGAGRLGLPEHLFRKQRYDRRAGKDMTWSFPVAPGVYEVRLYFAEIQSQAKGRHVTDVLVEGNVVVRRLDVFSEVGSHAVLSRRVTTSSDRKLNIRLRGITGRPSIAAIEILKKKPGPQMQELKSDSANCVGRRIDPSDDIVSLAKLSPPNTTFCVAPGVHRLTSPITPKSGQKFIGDGTAILSGAHDLRNWRKQGSVWIHGGQTQESRAHGQCIVDRVCNYNEDVYLDDRLLQRVTSPDDVFPGSFYFDYPGDEIVIADDPAGRRIEAVKVPFAFLGASGMNDVTIEGLMVEKFANPAQKGAIQPNGGLRWTVLNNEIRFNHGTGVLAFTGGLISNNYIHHNGQKGLGAVGDDIVIAENEVSYNNTAGFNPGWEAGGSKFALTRNLIVRENYVHHNVGNGLWTDIDNVDSHYKGNVVEDNWGQGIFHEISYDAVICNNVVRRNGLGRGGTWLYGAGILIAHSANVNVRGNLVEDNHNGIAGIQQVRTPGLYGPHLLTGLTVRGNTVIMPSGQSGVAQVGGFDEIFDSASNRFRGNHYYLRSPKQSFTWADTAQAPPEWRSYGHDRDGAFSSL